MELWHHAWVGKNWGTIYWKISKNIFISPLPKSKKNNKSFLIPFLEKSTYWSLSFLYRKLVLYCILIWYHDLFPEKFKPLFFIRTFDNSALLNFSYSLLIAVSYGRAKSHSKWFMMGLIFALVLKSDMVYCLHTLSQVFSL